MDLNLLKDILDILDERGVAEFELEEGGTRLRIKKGYDAQAPAAQPRGVTAPPPAAESASAPVVSAVAAPPAAAAAPQEAGLVEVASPIVGTFYRAPDPNSPPFVNAGDRVRVGQVLCIIEAMKLMNEIEAEVAGVIVKIHQEDGQPVQYGAPLFSVRLER